jgi:hypothetical protein
MPARLRTYQPPASHDNIVNLSTRAAGVELLCTMPLPFLPVVDPLAQPDWLDTSEEGRIDDPPTAARSGVDSHKDSHVAVLLDRRLDRWAGSAASTLRAGGWLVVVDLHPCTTGRPARSAHAGLSDADVGRSTSTTLGPTPTREADIGATATVQWVHSLGEVVTAVARAGLRVDRLVEHLSAEVDHRGGVLVRGRTAAGV